MIADDKLKALLTRDWAVRVLDAWLEPEHWWDMDHESPHITCVLHGPGLDEDWTFEGPTPDAARLAAAESVFRDLPADKRREVGQRP